MRILLFLLSILLFGCNCSTRISTSDDSAESDPYGWVTWDQCSQNIDDHPCNFTLTNHNGHEISLYDFYGDPIVVDFSTMWCGYCAKAADEIQSVQDAHPGLTYITVLIENEVGEPPSLEDAQRWAQQHGITSAPVLIADRSLLGTSSGDWYVGGWPTFYFIDSDMVLRSSLRGFSSTQIESMINDLSSK